MNRRLNFESVKSLHVAYRSIQDHCNLLSGPSDLVHLLSVTCNASCESSTTSSVALVQYPKFFVTQGYR